MDVYDSCPTMHDISCFKTRDWRVILPIVDWCIMDSNPQIRSREGILRFCYAFNLERKLTFFLCFGKLDTLWKLYADWLRGPSVLWAGCAIVNLQAPSSVWFGAVRIIKDTYVSINLINLSMRLPSDNRANILLYIKYPVGKHRAENRYGWRLGSI